MVKGAFTELMRSPVFSKKDSNCSVSLVFFGIFCVISLFFPQEKNMATKREIRKR
jgi:hypothetical protein